MCSPAPSVSLNLPRRSTTQACCCGTTRTIFDIRTITKMATTTTTINSPMAVPLVLRLLIYWLKGCWLALRGPNVNDKTFHGGDDAALAAREHRLADVARVPGRPAHLRLAQAGDGNLIDRRGLLADQRVDHFRALQTQFPHEPGPHEEESEERDHREREQLRPQRHLHAEGDQKGHHERADCEKTDVHRRRREFSGEQSDADENPDPPGHFVCVRVYTIARSKSSSSWWSGALQAAGLCCPNRRPKGRGSTRPEPPAAKRTATAHRHRFTVRNVERECLPSDRSTTLPASG